MQNKTHQGSQSACRGFTAIELLTATGIIFILMTILIPAIFRTREAARASQCLNSLKQLSLALHNYHDAHQTFPPGYISIMGIDGVELENEFGWGAFLLPFLDQQPLYQQIDFSTSVVGNTAPNGDLDSVFNAAKTTNATTAQTAITTFLCSMDQAAQEKAKQKYIFAVSSYSGVSGIHWMELPCATLGNQREAVTLELTAPVCRSPEGVFYLNSKTRLADIRDGTSQTMFIAETSTLFDYPNANVAFSKGNSTRLWGGTYWATAVNPLGQDHVLTATSAGINFPDEKGFSPGINSRHPGGAHIAFVDGSVRFLSEKIKSDKKAPYGVLQRLSTIQGSDVAIEF